MNEEQANARSRLEQLEDELGEFDDEPGLYGPDDVQRPPDYDDGPDNPDSEEGDDYPTRLQYCLTQQFVSTNAAMMLEAPPHAFGEAILQAEDWQLQTYEFTKLPTDQGAHVRAIAVLWVREVTFDPDAEEPEQPAQAQQQPVMTETREYLPVTGAPRSQYPTGNPADTAVNAPGSPGAVQHTVSAPVPAGMPAGGTPAVRVIDRGVQPLPENAAQVVAAGVAETQAAHAQRGVQVNIPQAQPPQAQPPQAAPPQPEPVVVAQSSGGPAPRARKVKSKRKPKAEPVDTTGEEKAGA